MLLVLMSLLVLVLLQVVVLVLLQVSVMLFWLMLMCRSAPPSSPALHDVGSHCNSMGRVFQRASGILF